MYGNCCGKVVPVHTVKVCLEETAPLILGTLRDKRGQLLASAALLRLLICGLVQVLFLSLIVVLMSA